MLPPHFHNHDCAHSFPVRRQAPICRSLILRNRAYTTADSGLTCSWTNRACSAIILVTVQAIISFVRGNIRVSAGLTVLSLTGGVSGIIHAADFDTSKLPPATSRAVDFTKDIQ